MQVVESNSSLVLVTDDHKSSTPASPSLPRLSTTSLVADPSIETAIRETLTGFEGVPLTLPLPHSHSANHIQLQQQQHQQQHQQHQQQLLQQLILQRQQHQAQPAYISGPKDKEKEIQNPDSYGASNKRQRTDDTAALVYANAIKYEPPEIERLIPVSGPISGGIEVTVLGKSFRSGLRCVFGGYEAPVTQLYGPTTLVVILPAAVSAGPVVVSLRDNFTQKMLTNPSDVIFTYINNVDRKLLELALQVLLICSNYHPLTA